MNVSSSGFGSARSLSNAIFVPSGDHTGHPLLAFSMSELLRVSEVGVGNPHLPVTNRVRTHEGQPLGASRGVGVCGDPNEQRTSRDQGESECQPNARGWSRAPSLAPPIAASIGAALALAPSGRPWSTAVTHGWLDLARWRVVLRGRR